MLMELAAWVDIAEAEGKIGIDDAGSDVDGRAGLVR